MRAKTILSILFLISLGTAAMLYLNALPLRAAAESSYEVLVAAMPLAAGTLLRPEDLAWKRTTSAGRVGQIFRPTTPSPGGKPQFDEGTLAKIYGSALRAATPDGTPIAWDSLVRPGDRDFLSTVLTPGARAIPLPLGAMTGALYPGDRVDVLLTQTFKSATTLRQRSVSEAIVENVRLLAIEEGDAKPSGSRNTGSRAATLEVTPEQAGRIAVAAELGKLSLTFRGDDDAGRPSAGAVRVARSPARGAIWAGDVSPALNGMSEAPHIEVIRGGKHEAVKSE